MNNLAIILLIFWVTLPSSKCNRSHHKNFSAVTVTSTTRKNKTESYPLKEYYFQNRSTIQPHDSDEVQYNFQLQRLIDTLSNLNLSNSNEQQLLNFFNITLNSNLKEIGQEFENSLGIVKELKDLSKNPDQFKNVLQTKSQDVPLGTLAKQLEGSTNFVSQLINILKTGHLPSLAETPLNPCNSLINCDLIRRSYQDFRDLINFSIDVDVLKAMLKGPKSFFHVLLSKFRQMFSTNWNNQNENN